MSLTIIELLLKNIQTEIQEKKKKGKRQSYFEFVFYIIVNTGCLIIAMAPDKPESEHILERRHFGSQIPLRKRLKYSFAQLEAEKPFQNISKKPKHGLHTNPTCNEIGL